MSKFSKSLSLALSLGAAMVHAETSKLWGSDGASWTSASRLPDFSWAGYRSRDAEPPVVAVVASIADSGALPNDTLDDADAIQKVLDHAPLGAIVVPKGIWILKKELILRRSGQVLRGATGSEFRMPLSLSEVHGYDPVTATKSMYAFSGGFIQTAGSMNRTLVDTVRRNALRGDRKLVLSAKSGLKVGDWIQVQQKDPGDHSLGKHLNAGLGDLGVDTWTEKPILFDWVAKVVAVVADTIVTDRPLRMDVRTPWSPVVNKVDTAKSLRNLGLENLTFRFPGTPKLAHLHEAGFNAIHLNNALNSWVKDITVIDADNGIILGAVRFSTVAGAIFKQDKRTGTTGHHALWATGNAQDNLFTGFAFQTVYVHDLTVEGLAHGNVFTHGVGLNLCFDHHRNAPYENLFTDLDVGNGSRIWASSGSTPRGPHTAARSTFWNIRKSAGSFPAVPNLTEAQPDWSQMNVIGLSGVTTAAAGRTDQWIELGAATSVEPANLYEAQLAHRKSLAAVAPAKSAATGAAPSWWVQGDQLWVRNSGATAGLFAFFDPSGRALGTTALGPWQTSQIQLPATTLAIARWQTAGTSLTFPVPRRLGPE